MLFLHRNLFSLFPPNCYKFPVWFVGTRLGGCGAAPSLHYSNEGSSLAQNRSPRLKSADGMSPSPRVSMELMPGWSSQFTPCHNPE